MSEFDEQLERVRAALNEAGYTHIDQIFAGQRSGFTKHTGGRNKPVLLGWNRTQETLAIYGLLDVAQWDSSKPHAANVAAFQDLISAVTGEVE